MKRFQIIFILLAFTCLAFNACSPKRPNASLLEGNYYVVSEWIGIDSGPAAQLYYQDESLNLIQVWPFFNSCQSAEGMFFSNDMAFFSAVLPDNKGRLVYCEIFAVFKAGPPVLGNSRFNQTVGGRISSQL